MNDVDLSGEPSHAAVRGDTMSGVAMDLVPGVPLGVGIGIVSGVTFLLLLFTASSRRLDFKAAVAVAGELLAIPTFWFGGPWLTTEVTSIDLDSMLDAYITSLAITFTLLMIYPLLRWVIRVGNTIGEVTSAE